MTGRVSTSRVRETICDRCRHWYAAWGVCPRCDGKAAWRRALRRKAARDA